jgi:hypothetical protein
MNSAQYAVHDTWDNVLFVVRVLLRVHVLLCMCGVYRYSHFVLGIALHDVHDNM